MTDHYSETMYGLRRGNQWVCTNKKKTKENINGNLTYVKGLRLDTEYTFAWLTPHLSVAIDRQRVLSSLPNGWSTIIQRIQ
jgi:hypothetical protein